MTMVDNGSVAVTLEYEHATLRFLDHVPTTPRPPYVGIGQLTRLPSGVALLSGFCGLVTRSHCWLILRALLADGFRVAYLERAVGHSAPGAEYIEHGDFAGLWRVDLSTAQDRRRKQEAV